MKIGVGECVEVEVTVETVRKRSSGIGNILLRGRKTPGPVSSKDRNALLFAGTLLDEPYSLPPKVIRLEADKYGGTVSVNMVPCVILGKRGFILRTEANEQGRGHHPKPIVEIASDLKLGDQFRLMDGDLVEIEVLEE